MKRLEVDAECIEKGLPRRGEACPIARAYRKAAKRPGLPVSVSGGELAAYWSRYTHVHHLPTEAKAFIKSFDEGRRVKPFAFDLGPARLIDREGRPSPRFAVEQKGAAS